MACVGQALWVVENGVKVLSQGAANALAETLKQFSTLDEWNTNDSYLYEEIAKIEAWIGPPAGLQQPLLTYAKWYLQELHRMKLHSCYLFHGATRALLREYDISFVIDLYGEQIIDHESNRQLIRVLWIDMIKEGGNQPHTYY